MADDPGKEPLENNINDQPDHPREIIPDEETKTIAPIQKTENMEGKYFFTERMKSSNYNQNKKYGTTTRKDQGSTKRGVE